MFSNTFSKRLEAVNKTVSKHILEATQLRLQNVVIKRFINQSKALLRRFQKVELFAGWSMLKSNMIHISLLRHVSIDMIC